MIRLSKFTAYEDFISTLLVRWEIEEGELQGELDLVKAKHTVKAYTGSNSSERVNIAKAEAAMDPEVEALRVRYEQARSRRKLYAVMVNTMARGAAVCSRELTRRTGGFAPERRANRYNP